MNLAPIAVAIILSAIGASLVIGGLLSLLLPHRKTSLVLILSGLGFIAAGCYVW